MDKRVAKLFAEYGKSFSTLALQNTAHLYAKDFIAAGPRGVISQTRDAFIENAAKAAEFYRSVGQQKAEAKSMTETWFSDNYVMVTIHWAVSFKTLDKPAEFDVSYLVQLTEDEPRIILFISHEDEQETMKKLGLLKAA